jgi:hypothetical protein
MFRFFRKKTKAPEDLIFELAGMGFNLNSPEAKTRLLAELRDADTEDSSTLASVLALMADEQYDPDSDTILPWLSDDAWHFDFEAIEDHGAYKLIVENCVRISRGKFSVSNLVDFVDIENEVANVSFKYLGEARKIELEVDNDWADPMLFVKLNSLLDETDHDRRFCKHDLGQDCLLAFKSPEEIRKINSSKALRFWEFRN